jgi:hypothetical protein
MSTLRKEIHGFGVNSCIVVRKPFLSDIHKAKSIKCYNYDCLAPTFKSRTLIIVWGALSGSSKSYLVLIPPNRCTAMDFVEIVYEGVLEHYY